MTDPKKIIEKTASGILSSLAKTFPVACASDEFYYFPHIATDHIQDSTWDDFSPASVSKVITNLAEVLSMLKSIEIPATELDLQTDRNVLLHFLTTLQDHLGEHLTWKKQPSFYLTLMNIGLVQAMRSEDPEIIHRKVKLLPGFIEQAARNLEDIPSHWLEIGLSMIPDCENLLVSIPGEITGKDQSLDELDHLKSALKNMKPAEEHDMTDESLKKIYNRHLATGLNLSEISKILENEIGEMWEMMVEEAGKILKDPVKLSQNPGNLIGRVYQYLMSHEPPQDDMLILFENEINKIRNHMVDSGILTDDLKQLCPVIVREMPGYIRAIRSASSYSIDPQHPPQKGTFFVLSHVAPGKPIIHQVEYRMLTAHETYPGHHLLDSSRLSLQNIIRRSLEFPVFYEGWACFAEMLLEITGYFSSPADRFILAKRRYWRAIRGQVDVGLQTKRLDFNEAANIMQDAGIQMDRALPSVRIYTLNPGYQICYTVGIRRFLDLYNRWGRGDTVHFVRTVLGGGEILFGDLERRLGRI